jgi:hypothetical protein
MENVEVSMGNNPRGRAFPLEMVTATSPLGFSRIAVHGAPQHGQTNVGFTIAMLLIHDHIAAHVQYPSGACNAFEICAQWCQHARRREARAHPKHLDGNSGNPRSGFGGSTT